MIVSQLSSPVMAPLSARHRHYWISCDVDAGYQERAVPERSLCGS